jgi:recombination protein RecT
MGLAVAYVRRDEKLREAVAANPAAFMIALRECAALGHVPMRGTFSLVPFKSRQEPSGWAVSGIEEVRGTIQRMFRAGGVTSVHVELVHENDQFAWSPTRMIMPVHELDWQASEDQRGPITGVYSFARLRGGGTSQVVVMNMRQVARYEAAAKTDKFWKGQWRPEMIQKTALHRLEKFVPTSAEYLWNLNAAEAGSSRVFPDLPDRPAADPGYADGGIVDAELVPDTPASGGEWPGGGTNA